MKECMVLRDLFPLYREGLLRDDTAAIMEEHLLECKACKISYGKYCQEKLKDEIKGNQEEEEKDKRFLKLFRKYRKHLIIMTGVLSVGLLTMLTLAALFLTLVFTGGWAKKSKNIADYPQILTEESNMRTGFFVFPEEITEEMTDITFDYYYKDTMFDPTISVFLQATYEEEQYQEEIDRLSNLEKKQTDGVKKLLRDEQQKYPYPAFIAVENHGNSYEYALLSGENQITYIYTLFFTKEDIRFDEQYLPDDFMNEEGKEFGSGYSIYVRAQGSGAISYDYMLN